MLQQQDLPFYMKQMPEKMCMLADIANNELQSNRVPKTKMNRGTKKQADEKAVQVLKALGVPLESN